LLVLQGARAQDGPWASRKHLQRMHRPLRARHQRSAIRASQSGAVRGCLGAAGRLQRNDMLVKSRRTPIDDTVALAGNGTDRASRLRAAAAALDLIASEIGPAAAVVLLADAWETAASRLRGEIEPRKAPHGV
jgi:hypothetical protein